MHLGRKLVTGFVLLCAFVMLGPATALASGGGNGCSAGDNQYVDPLGGGCNNTPGSHHHHHSGGGSNSGSTNPSSTTSSSSGTTSDVSTTTSSTTSRSSGTAADPAKSKTLPFTGLDLWPCLALGIGLIGSGAALRRTTRLPRSG